MSEFSSPSGTESPSPQSDTAARTRQILLISLMVLMLAALWYDYKVARPSVEKAYDHIAKLNANINGKGGSKYLTDLDVQKELGRAPLETFVKNQYYIEVYGWRGGIPTKHHKYFAIYTEGRPHALLTHSKNNLDEELVRPRTVQLAEVDREEGEPVAGGRMPGVPKKEARAAAPPTSSPPSAEDTKEGVKAPFAEESTKAEDNPAAETQAAGSP